MGAPVNLSLAWDLNPRSLGASFANIFNGGAAITLFTAAANTNGALLRSLTLGSAALNYFQIVAAATAPGSHSDTTRRAFLRGYTNGQTPNILVMERPILIPAGNGLFIACSAAAACEVTATWDFL